MRPGRALAIAAAAAMALALLGWLAVDRARQQLEAPLAIGPEPAVLEVAPGTSARALGAAIAERGWLDHPRLFSLYARSRGDAARLKAGEYRIAPGTTAATLLDQLVAGRVTQYSFTIIEGWTFAELRSALAREATLTHELAGAADDEVMARLDRPGTHPEGRFLPETYRYPRGTSDTDLLRRAADAMDRALADAWRERDDELPLAGADELLVLASIVEKETGLASERPEVAGVFVRRLRRNMRLQSDPTVIYGLGERFDGDIRRRDLRDDTPWNTYTRAGLPPTPIALPGAASLRAAARPAPGTALYFVATGEGDGSHYFSDTLDEHNAAVQRYLARLRSD